MCGRFVAASPPEELAAFFDAENLVDPLDVASCARFNVAPTDPVLVCVREGDGRVLDTYRWGLVPGFARDPRIGNRMINARSETAATNRAFRYSFEHRRCLVPATGFYEWRRSDRQPYFIHRADGEPLVFAGLWAEWHGRVAGEESVLRSTAILTRAANGFISPIHDRMPVVLDRSQWVRWLDPGTDDGEEPLSSMGPPAEDVLVMHPVGRAVNNARNDGPDLIVAVEDPGAGPVQGVLL
ncbi:MAG: SOS response-associated peptidase [Microthrixaceae bacterium]